MQKGAETPAPPGLTEKGPLLAPTRQHMHWADFRNALIQLQMMVQDGLPCYEGLFFLWQQDRCYLLFGVCASRCCLPHCGSILVNRFLILMLNFTFTYDVEFYLTFWLVLSVS